MFHIFEKSEKPSRVPAEVLFSVLVNRRTAMVLNNEDKILIGNLYLFENYSARKLIKEFSEKS